MKSRILDFLKRIALKQLKPFEVEDILKDMGLDEIQASPLAFGLMNDVIRQYHYFQVQTIDSFVNILLVGCSFKIGLSARFKIQRNSREYLQLSLDELLDQADQDDKVYKHFSDFVRQYLFLENRSGWFPREDLLKVLVELFRQYNTYQKPLLVFQEDNDQPIFARKKKIHALMLELKELLPAKTKKVLPLPAEASTTRTCGRKNLLFIYGDPNGVFQNFSDHGNRTFQRALTGLKSPIQRVRSERIQFIEQFLTLLG